LNRGIRLVCKEFSKPKLLALGRPLHFIIPLFKQVPARYREKYFKTIPAREMLKGLIEAFQLITWSRLSRVPLPLTGSPFADKRILGD